MEGHTSHRRAEQQDVPTLQRLTILIGGLCMLVQRDPTREDPQGGLYVLMPVMRVDGMWHCPMMITDQADGYGGRKYAFPYGGQSLDLRDLAEPSTRVKIPDMVAAASRYSGLSVSEEWLTQGMHGCLAARAIIPLAYKRIEPASTVANLIVPEPGVPKPKRPVKQLVGRVKLSFQVEKEELTELFIGSTRLLPDAGGEITFELVNIPKSHLHRTKEPKHNAGDIVHHVRAYYGLMDGWCGLEPPTDLDLIVADDGGEEVDPMDDRNCFDRPEPVPEIVHFIYPYNCTIGSGCAPGQSDC